MAGCKSNKYVGKDVVLEFHIGCGDVLPVPSDWKRFGSLRTKELSIEWETTDATADDSIGSLRENLATFQTMSISGDGVHKVAGTGADDLTTLTKHYINPTATAGQPVVWMRMTFPDLTFTAFMLLSNLSRSAPYDDVTTYSLEASATASDFGLLVEDTPDPDADDVASVAVTPTTADLQTGQTSQVAVTVLPVTAPQSVAYQSSDTNIATVSQNGLITAVGEGNAVITVRSSVDATKTATVAVTVDNA